MATRPTLAIDDLRIGHYVELDLKWFEHPFAFNAFRIRSEDQIRTLQGLGLQRVMIDPARSEVAAVAPPMPVPETAADGRAELLRALAAKRDLIERIKRQREAAARVESAFVDTAGAVRRIERQLASRPAEAVQEAGQLVDKIARSILDSPELAIHVMGDVKGGEDLYLHSLNVAMLSLMMARNLQLPADSVQSLGLGALMHDIGRRDIPSRILQKKERLSEAERNLYQMHCQYGVEAGTAMGLPPAVLGIIGQHHECYDGSGYPQRLAGESISPLARMVAIANYYDELCNPPDPADALTPHEALSLMFARMRARFDPALLQVFIRCLGVYPPGTLVQLANGAIAMVVTINTEQPMKPTVMVYDRDVAKEDAILVDMAEAADTNIVKAIRPGQVPREAYNYLSPRHQISYFFDGRDASGGRKSS